MPQPASLSAEQRPDLGKVAFDFMLEADQQGFIAGKLLPEFPVDLQSAQYPIIKKEAFLKVVDTKRAMRAGYSRDDYNWDFDSYATEEHGFESVLDDREKKLYARYFDLEVVGARRATDKILRAKEVRVAAQLFNTANITQTADVAIAWNTAATAVPHDNVTAAKIAMRAASGIDPNVGTCSKKVFDTVMLTAAIRDAFKYTNPIEVGGYEARRRLLAQYFGLDDILVAGGMKDSADPGLAATIAEIWDDEYFGLFRVNASADLQVPCIGRTFRWTNEQPAGTLVTEAYREEKIRSNVIRVRGDMVEKIVFAGAGYLMGNIIHP
jgi:hypothetical protein